jgi:hypothetical protein
MSLNEKDSYDVNKHGISDPRIEFSEEFEQD